MYIFSFLNIDLFVGKLLEDILDIEDGCALLHSPVTTAATSVAALPMIFETTALVIAVDIPI